MIQKLQTSDYLRRYKGMDMSERLAYEKSVADWLKNDAPLLKELAEDPAAQYQSVMQIGQTWNDKACQSFQRGASLLTALVGQMDVWIPDMIFIKTAKRSIKHMVSCLRERVGQPCEEMPKKSTSESSSQQSASPAASAGSTLHSAPSNHLTPKAPLSPVRPKHIDQYIHLLPEKTQKRASSVKQLLRDLDDARENARRLMDAGDAADKIAQWARQATKLDGHLRDIYMELDEEWQKLVDSGRVKVDILGNAYITDDANDTKQKRAKQQKPLDADAKKRINTLRTWLRDTRYGDGDKRAAYVEKWIEKYRELTAIGGSATDAIRKAAEHYGIKIEEL